MKAKSSILIATAMILFIAGFSLRIIPQSTLYDENAVAILGIVGVIMIVASAVLFVLSYLQISKDTKQAELERQKAVTDAMSMQAQAEYNKKLAAYRKDGAHADALTQAKLFAQAVETLTLKAPSTAVFSDLDETAIAEDNGMYTVTGWVDAQNSFGAMLRTPFSIVVLKKDGVWQIVSVFESTEAALKKKFATKFVLYLIVAVIGTALLYFVIQTIMEL